MHAKKFDAAVAILRPLADGFAEGGATLSLVRVLAPLAAAYALAQRSQDAEATLESALRAAGSEPLVRSFVDEGSALREPLRRAVARLDPGSHWQRAFDGAFPSRGANAHVAPFPKAAEIAPLLATLSDRERQILGHLAEGKQNKQIANLLFVSPETVKWHLKRIYDKLSVSSRTEAARLAVICGRP
jgi:LuxR family maltose regulon positive regulatory protein